MTRRNYCVVASKSFSWFLKHFSSVRASWTFRRPLFALVASLLATLQGRGDDCALSCRAILAFNAFLQLSCRKLFPVAATIFQRIEELLKRLHRATELAWRHKLMVGPADELDTVFPNNVVLVRAIRHPSIFDASSLGCEDHIKLCKLNTQAAYPIYR